MARPPARSVSISLSLLGVCWFAAGAGAQCLEEEVRPAIVGSGSYYGFSIARSGDLLAVGAPGTALFGAGAGAVYALDAVGAEWLLASVLFADDIGPGDESGASVGISGDTLIVGVRGDDQAGTDAGSARVYERIGLGWVEVATLLDPTGSSADEFGASVAIDGDVAVVGSPYDIEGGIGAGSISIFRRVGGIWQHEAKRTAAGGGAGDFLGSAVAVEGNTIAVGAPGANGAAGADLGAVVVFERQGGVWIEVAALAAPDAQPGDLLGAAVALRGALVLAGAPYDSDFGLEAGAVVPFRRIAGVWSPAAAIASPIPGDLYYFGAAIDIDGAEVLVGEPFANVGGEIAAGRAHRFLDTGSAFTLQDTLEDPDADDSSLFGCAVAIEGGEAIVGAYFDAVGGFASGNALRFVLDGADCDGSGVPDLCEIADGLLVDCDADGVPDSCQIAAGTASDCDLNGAIDSCDIAEGAPDCDRNGLLDSCEIAVSDCNANGLLDACEPDCNQNGAPDDCDIASGASPDCNANGNPDECDIFFGIDTDCDGNSIPDGCDLASGQAEDCNTNGISDACDILSGTSADADGDGVPDECGPRFIRGDANGDLALDIADAVTLLSWVTGIGPVPPCLVAADANDDAQVDIADGVYVASWVTGIGVPPPPPFPACGLEPAPPSGIACDDEPPCP